MYIYTQYIYTIKIYITYAYIVHDVCFFGRGQKLDVAGSSQASADAQSMQALVMQHFNGRNADVLTVPGGNGRCRWKGLNSGPGWDHPETGTASSDSSAGLHQKMHAAVGHAQGTKCIRHVPKDHCPKFAHFVEIKVYQYCFKVTVLRDFHPRPVCS